jgi:hypothetical protein
MPSAIEQIPYDAWCLRYLWAYYQWKTFNPPEHWTNPSPAIYPKPFQHITGVYFVRLLE